MLDPNKDLIQLMISILKIHLKKVLKKFVYRRKLFILLLQYWNKQLFLIQDNSNLRQTSEIRIDCIFFKFMDEFKAWNLNMKSINTEKLLSIYERMQHTENYLKKKIIFENFSLYFNRPRFNETEKRRRKKNNFFRIRPHG